jgi:hypothetical protein
MISKRFNNSIILIFHGLLSGFTVILLLMLMQACAVQSPISGGEKDILPPKVERSEPRNFSTGFAGEKIIITLSEFSTLKDIEKQVLISPPVAKDPDFRMRGKSLVITFREPLQKDATYNIYMGNAIVDITEGNPIPDYSFVFSTGSKIDSLGMNGSVLTAFDQTPPKDALAMLYDGASDSLPYLSRPLYVARVNDKGDFKFQNIREGSFKLIILQDQDGNFLYNKGEAIAFADTMIHARQVIIQKDSMGKAIPAGEQLPGNIAMSMFTENDSVQRILRAAIVASNHLQISARLPIKSPKLLKFDDGTPDKWYLMETNASRDTLNFWLKNINSDSLHFIVSDGARILDTMDISLVYKGKEGQKAEREGNKKKLRIRTNVSRQGSFPLHTQLLLVSENPLKKADFSSFKLLEDTIQLRPEVQFTDSLKRRIIFKNTLKEATSYQLIIPDSVFEDIYGLANDSVAVKFKTRSLTDYGSLAIKIHLSSARLYIIQLISEAGKVIQEDPIDVDGKIVYPFLLPGKYTLKAILDKNRNAKWDSGNYLRHLQPEQIIVYPKVLDLRANWEQEEDWIL